MGNVPAPGRRPLTEGAAELLDRVGDPVVLTYAACAPAPLTSGPRCVRPPFL